MILFEGHYHIHASPPLIQPEEEYADYKLGDIQTNDSRVHQKAQSPRSGDELSCINLLLYALPTLSSKMPLDLKHSRHNTVKNSSSGY